MFRNVLVPVDGSPAAERALPAALAVCRRAGAGLQLVHVRSHFAEDGYALADDPARAYLDDLATRVGADLGRNVPAAVLPERAPALLKPAPSPDTVAAMVATHAQQSAVDLMVLTTHGRSGISRLWFGSVAEALLRRSHIPLLLIRPGDADEDDRWNTDRPLERALVATDGSDVSHRAVELAASFRALFPAEYTLLRVVPLPYEVLGNLSAVTVAYSGQDMNESVAHAQERLRQESVVLDGGSGEAKMAVVVDPSPGRAILNFARDHAMDLVVIASRSRGGLDRFLLGSIADKVIRGGETPLLVQQPEMEEISAENAALAARAEAGEA